MNESSSRQMHISPVWLQVAVLTFVVGFAILGYLAIRAYHDQPPQPASVVDERGGVLFTGKDILTGQHVFQKYGLMQHGSLFGHGAYLGPDFTAQYLHEQVEEMAKFYAGGAPPTPEVLERIRVELKTNRFDSANGVLVFSRGQAQVYEHMRGFYTAWFGPVEKQTHLQRPQIQDTNEVRCLTAYFAWAAWVTTATRPGTTYSYTNNWPPEPLAGNHLTAESLVSECAEPDCAARRRRDHPVRVWPL